MGKATRWFRAILGLKKPDPEPNPSVPNVKPSKDRRRWSFVKSYREKEKEKHPKTRAHSYDVNSSDVVVVNNVSYDDNVEANKHAIAVAAATAAVAEAAVAAAQAAAAVVRLTHSGRCGGVGGGGERVGWAAVVVQSCFRGYLARRALRALKGLVKLQALVRGHIVRQTTAETMRRMQAMLRAQARARTVRAYVPDTPHSSSKSSQFTHPGPPTPEKTEQSVRVRSANKDQSPKMRRNGSRSNNKSNTVNRNSANFSSCSDPRMPNEPIWDAPGTSSRTCVTDDDRADRIVEMDTGRSQFNLRRRNLFESSYSGLLTSDQISYTTSKDSTTHHTIPSPASCEVVQPLNPLKLSQERECEDDGLYCTAENSPNCHSATSQAGNSSRRGGSCTPTLSDGARSFLSGYSDCPSYMAYTESAKAKMRSLSAPKQRPNYERERTSLSTKRYSVHGLGEHYPRYASGHRGSAMQASFASKGYPGSGRLDRLGMPVKDSTVVYYSGYLN